MSIIIEEKDPGVEGVRNAVGRYVERYPDYRQALEMYGSIMEVQQEALSGITCDLEMSEDWVLGRLEEGLPLLESIEVPVDPGRLCGLVEEVCRLVDESREPGFPYCEELVSWEGLKEGMLQKTISKVLAGEDLSLGRDWEDSGDRALASHVIWESLVPFYRKCGSILQSRVDHSYWQIGYCPICGCPPLIGKFRSEDGLWVLECSLCHTPWNVKRSHCPFCTERKEAGLEYLYVDDNDSQRAQYCHYCKHYVKTVNLRDSGRFCLLPLEDIVTVRLDMAARQEGLKPPPGFLERGGAEETGSLRQ